MKKILLFIITLFFAFNSFAQNTLEVIDTGNITRERWRDSVLRIDMSQVPTGFLLEYSMFGFESDKFDGVGNDDDTIKNDGRICTQTNKNEFLLNIGAYSGYGYPDGLPSTETSGIPTIDVGAEYFLNKYLAIGSYIAFTYTFDKFVGSTERYKDVWRGWDIGIKTTFHFNPLLAEQLRKKADVYISGFVGYTTRSLRYDKSNIYRDSLNFNIDALSIGEILGLRYSINRKIGLYGELGKSRNWFLGGGINVTINQNE